MIRRRYFLKSGASVTSALLLSGCDSLDTDASMADLQVGGTNLLEIEAIDTHVHPPIPVTLSDSYEMWNSSFVNAMLPSYEYEGKETLRTRLEKTFKSHLYRMPRQTGYNNYIARTYGVEPNIQAFDRVVSAGIERGFKGYIQSILDRENISSVVLESREAIPKLPKTAIPADRFVWTCPIVDLIQPAWAEKKGLSKIADVREAISDFMEKAVVEQCRGFKSSVAYYRPLHINVVSEAVAERALTDMLSQKPTQYVPSSNVPDYQEPELRQSFRNYQDHLLRHIFIKAGELRTPILMHSAVALHPALRFEFNSPLALHKVFLDDDIKRAETQFVLIHTGYPYHEHVAAMLSQFPNVYTDLSFFSKFPGVLEETLKTFLALAPSEKIMHGSDSNNVPEEIGYCAWNTRQVLGKILRTYRKHYGWSQRDCNVIAQNVLRENAVQLFKI